MKLTLEEAMEYHKKLYETIRDMPNYDKYNGQYFSQVCGDVSNKIVWDKGRLNFTCFLCEFAYSKCPENASKLDRCKYCPVFDEINTCEEYRCYCTVRDIFANHVILYETETYQPYSIKRQAPFLVSHIYEPISIAEDLTIRECCDKISKLRPRRDCE